MNRTHKAQLLFLIVCSLCFGTPTHGQNLDSLWSIWDDNSQPDSTRLIAMEKFITSGYFNSKPDSALYFIEIAYDFAEKKGLRKYMVDHLNLKGFHFLPRNDSLALEYLNNSQELAEEINYHEGIANSLKNIGTVYLNRGNHHESIQAYEEGLAIAEEHHLVDLKWKFLVNIGVVFVRQNNYPNALDYYQRGLVALTELDDTDNRQFVGIILFNISGVHSAQGEYQKSIEYYNESLEVARSAGNKTLTAAILANIGDAYGKLEDYEVALSYLKQALEYYQDLQERPAIVTTLQSMAHIYFLQNELDQSLAFAEQGLVLSKELAYQVGTAISLTIMGKNYWKKGNYSTAIAHCEEGLAVAAEIETLKEQQEACDCLYRAYRDAGEASEALGYYEQLIVIRDSIFNTENTRKLTQLEMQYDFDKKEAIAKAEQEQKDALAAQELRRQKLVRNGFMGGFAVVFLFAGTFFVQRNRIGKEKQRNEELLLNILPEEVAEELKVKGYSDARLIDQITVLFTDFKGFTALSEKVTPKELVADLHECFSAFDRICEKYGIEKIKTIGDAYMAAGGLPSPNQTHAEDVVNAALEMAEVIERDKAKKVVAGLPLFEIRIGIHTGPVVAGIVGVKKFQYDIWGDNVNTASRMESSGEVGKVNISQVTQDLLKDNALYSFEYRGKIKVKGKDEIEMYFVSRG